MALMRVTPMYKSKWGWLAILAYLILLVIAMPIFGKVINGFVVGTLVATVLVWWLWPLAKKAQLEQDWELPQTPRVNIHE